MCLPSAPIWRPRQAHTPVIAHAGRAQTCSEHGRALPARIEGRAAGTALAASAKSRFERFWPRAPPLVLSRPVCLRPIPLTPERSRPAGRSRPWPRPSGRAGSWWPPWAGPGGERRRAPGGRRAAWGTDGPALRFVSVCVWDGGSKALPGVTPRACGACPGGKVLGRRCAARGESSRRVREQAGRKKRKLCESNTSKNLLPAPTPPPSLPPAPHPTWSPTAGGPRDRARPAVRPPRPHCCCRRLLAHHHNQARPPAPTLPPRPPAAAGPRPPGGGAGPPPRPVPPGTRPPPSGPRPGRPSTG